MEVDHFKGKNTRRHTRIGMLREDPEKVVEYARFYGFAEGLMLTGENIFLLLDSDREKMIGRDTGENGALIVVERPLGF